MNEPKALRVELTHGQPVAIVDGGHRHRIVQIQDSWLVEDEWWRQPIRRRYYAVLLDGGQLRTIYHDQTTDTWYAQAY